jgi:hypothetical protein
LITATPKARGAFSSAPFQALLKFCKEKMATEKRLQILLDKQEIYKLMCRYCRGCDRLDKGLVLSCFWPGAIDIHIGKGGKIYTGKAEEFFEGEWEGFKEFTTSQPYLCNHLCEVDGEQALAEPTSSRSTGRHPAMTRD